MLFSTPSTRLCNAMCIAVAFALEMGVTTPGFAQYRVASSYQAAVTLPPRITALDSINGFRTYTFGTRVSDWPTPLVGLRTTRRGQLIAENSGEPVVIGDLILRGVRLSFYNGRLARLIFAPTSEAYATELLRVLRAQYGRGQQAGIDRVVWRGQLVTLVYELVITNKGRGRQVESTRQGQASLISNALWAEAEADKVLR